MYVLVHVIYKPLCRGFTSLPIQNRHHLILRPEIILTSGANSA